MRQPGTPWLPPACDRGEGFAEGMFCAYTGDRLPDTSAVSPVIMATFPCKRLSTFQPRNTILDFGF